MLDRPIIPCRQQCGAVRGAEIERIGERTQRVGVRAAALAFFKGANRGNTDAGLFG
jgi:hypothetical protein